MDFELNAVEQRVLGCLIEKEMSTPDHYPLALNALVNACNQKNNRQPVMELEHSTVEHTLYELRTEHKLAVRHSNSWCRVSYRYSCLSDDLFQFRIAADYCGLNFTEVDQTVLDSGPSLSADAPIDEEEDRTKY